mgnify:CR=1 FL=1
MFKFTNASLIAISLLVITSCTGNDPIDQPVIPEVSTVVENINNGTLNGTLKAEDDLIQLNANTTYQLTGSFIVDAGAEIIIPAGTNIIANAGGVDVYFAVLKGGKVNINGTDGNPVIMTSTNNNPGDWGGLTICGDATTTAGVNATAEVGGFIYGGSNDADNSGSIKNLVIKGTGAQINTESQYNGVSLYAVGSGTTIENIAIFDGADDGIEFFGGTVSAKNIYLENLEDDAIDWTEGWSGTVENSYISNTKTGFSTVVEADKDNGNPKLINVTAVSLVGGTALQFKKQSGATITNLYLSGYDKNIDMKDEGPLENVVIDGEAASTEKAYSTGTKVAISNWNFISGETTIVEALNGDLTTDKTLSADVTYNLTGAYIVKDGAKLTIEAGTKIIADAKGTDVYLAVLQGGEIDIQGEANNPVVMSSGNANPGDWGGLTICGKATTTAGINATAEVGGFIYGGTDDTDNSGSIKYLVIKGTGAQINTESQYNGISLYAVGSGTTIENIAVINGADDGVEFFGGTVSAENVYLQDNEDDAVDWTEGWNGTITNTYVKHDIEGFSTAVEADKDNANPKLINFTAISTTGGIGLQFKKQSGASITNLYLSGYDTNVDMKDDGPLANVIIDGEAATTTAAYDSGTQVAISTWSWITAGL